MLSIEITIGVLAGIAIVLGAVGFFILRKTRFKFAGFIVFGGLAALTYFVVFTHVYILDDDLADRYEEKVALFDSEFTFKDGSSVTISPEFALRSHSLIVNNTNDRHSFSVVVYSSSSNARGPRPVALHSYSVKAVQYKPHYIYRSAPSSIRTRGNSNVYRGVIK